MAAVGGAAVLGGGDQRLQRGEHRIAVGDERSKNTVNERKVGMVSITPGSSPPVSAQHGGVERIDPASRAGSMMLLNSMVSAGVAGVEDAESSREALVMCSGFTAMKWRFARGLVVAAGQGAQQAGEFADLGVVPGCR